MSKIQKKWCWFQKIFFRQNANIEKCISHIKCWSKRLSFIKLKYFQIQPRYCHWRTTSIFIRESRITQWSQFDKYFTITYWKGNLNALQVIYNHTTPAQIKEGGYTFINVLPERNSFQIRLNQKPFVAQT